MNLPFLILSALLMVGTYGSLQAQMPNIQVSVGLQYRITPIPLAWESSPASPEESQVIVNQDMQVSGTSAGIQLIKQIENSPFYLSLSQFVKYDHLYYDLSQAELDNPDTQEGVFARSMSGPLIFCWDYK
ncbi:MAG: hypothetical protein AAF399_22725 [Bacteroidota bacterium]